MAADVEAEDLQLGAHPVLRRHLGQPGDGLLRLVAEVEGELDRVDRPRRLGRLRLGGGPRPHALVGERVPLGQRAGLLLAGVGVGAVAAGGGVGALGRGGRLAGAGEPAAAQAAALGAVERAGMPVELGDLEQQVAAGDPAPAADPFDPAR